MLVTADVPSSEILVTLMMEGLHSIETPVLTRETRRNIQEDGILRDVDTNFGRISVSVRPDNAV
jgi:hypothetical protein